jgi:hypothetical protein
MTSSTGRFIKPAIIILILCLLFTGCISRTEVQPAPATPVPTAFVPKGTAPSLPAPSPVTVTVTVLDDGSKNCSQLQGTVAIPGQVCPGTWLTATDSFSCCSKTPVAGKTAKPRLTIVPLDLRIAHNDTFVEIGTG